MPVSLINPNDHIQVPLYHHVAVATGTRQLFLAGQVSWDEHGELVAPGDLAGQVLQVHKSSAGDGHAHRRTKAATRCRLAPGPTAADGSSGDDHDEPSRG